MQLEVLIIPFYLIYGLEFLIRLVQYKSWKLAYLNISFEREAYCNEKDLEYLYSRSIFVDIMGGKSQANQYSVELNEIIIMYLGNILFRFDSVSKGFEKAITEDGIIFSTERR